MLELNYYPITKQFFPNPCHMVFFEREIKNQIQNKNKTNGQVMMSWKIKLNETKKTMEFLPNKMMINYILIVIINNVIVIILVIDVMIV